MSQPVEEILVKFKLPPVTRPDVVGRWPILLRGALVVDYDEFPGILIFPDIINSAKQGKVGGLVVDPGSLEILSPLVQILVLDG